MDEQLNLFDYLALDSEARVVIRQRTAEIKTLVKSTAESILQIGEKLYEVKEEMIAMRDRQRGKGKSINCNSTVSFDSWLSAEFGWSRASAYNFIKVFKAFGGRENIGDIAASALYLLSAASDSARERALREAAGGEKISRAKRDRLPRQQKQWTNFCPTSFLKR